MKENRNNRLAKVFYNHLALNPPPLPLPPDEYKEYPSQDAQNKSDQSYTFHKLSNR